MLHARFEFVDEFGRDVFLHEQARTGAAYLALVEPDRIHHAFDSSVQVGILEHHKRRLAAQLQ